MATGGGSAKVVEDPDETSAFPDSSPKNGVPRGEEMLEIEDPIEFVDPLSKDFECSLCLQYLKQPALTSCGHHFCKQCIDRVVERSRKLKQDPVCPLCKEQDFQMLIDRKTERKISSLQVYCLKKSQGCRWEGELGSLDHHMDLKQGDCAFVEVECEFSEMGCTAKVLRKDILKHMEENTHKHIILMSVLGSMMSGGSLESSRKLQERRAEMLQMQLCRRDEEFQQRLESLEKKLEMKSDELADMEQKLKLKDQELVNIGERLKEKDDQLGEVQRNIQEKELHIQELQNSVQRKEEQADIKRKLQEQQGEMQQQLQTSENDLKQRITVLEKQLQEEDRKLEKELQAQIRSIKVDLDSYLCRILPYDFIMPNFTKLMANSTSWYSPPFYTHHGGYKLSLRVEANGYGGRWEGTSVSWCLYTEPGEFDQLLKWPRRHPECPIQLLNHCTGKWDGVPQANSICSYGTFKKPDQQQQCIDCWHHIRHSDLNTQCLKDDCLHFKISKIQFTD